MPQVAMAGAQLRKGQQVVRTAEGGYAVTDELIDENQ